jgi:hypothetical protein
LKSSSQQQLLKLQVIDQHVVLGNTIKNGNEFQLNHLSSPLGNVKVPIVQKQTDAALIPNTHFVNIQSQLLILQSRLCCCEYVT